MKGYSPLPSLEAVRTERARRSLHEFIRQAWHVVDPDPFVDGIHIEAIAAHLEAVERGEIRNLIINIPPRHSKSMICGVLYPAWVWIDRPEMRWLCSSYAGNLSTRDSVKCRRLITSPWYQARWGDRFSLAGDQNLKTRFDNDKGGYRYSTSVGGQTTGDGGDRIIVDDPHNVQQAESDVQRLSAIEWWDGAMSSRGNNPKTVARIVVMQRLHEEDLTGHLLAQGGYEHLCIPAEYEPDHPFARVTSIGWEDPRRKEGELLTPERFGKAEIEELHRRLGSLRATGQLQQRPAPKDGAFFRREWFHLIDAAPVAAQRVRAWDLAATEDGDFTVGVRMAKTPEGLFVIEDVVRGRWTPAARDAVILSTAQMDGAECAVWFEEEPGSAGKSQSASLIRMLAGHNARAERMTGDKETRAAPLAAQMEAGNVKLVRAESNKDLLSEFLQFPVGKNDDQVDATALAFGKLAGKREITFF